MDLKEVLMNKQIEQKLCELNATLLDLEAFKAKLIQIIFDLEELFRLVMKEKGE
jgi:uncharacterized protein YfkK (UPF0435 family)